MRSKKHKNKGIKRDIISKLPNDILSNIISRLETKDAVKTSVLSSKWKYLWTSINNLRFIMPRQYPRKDKTLLVDFVEHVIHHCRSNSIKEFHLDMDGSIQRSDAARIEDMVSWVIARNVHTLTLKFNISEFEIVGGRLVFLYDEEGPLYVRPVFRLPQSILTCLSLVKLTLDCRDPIVDIPESAVCFPSLRFLSISFMEPPPDLPNKLLGSCPVLEELVLKGDVNDDGIFPSFDINIPSLKKLKLFMFVDGEIVETSRCVIRACNLEYLRVVDYFTTCMVMEEDPFLHKLILDGFTSEIEEDINRAMLFIKAISCTRCLLLSAHVVGFVVHGLIDNLPLFCNVVHIYLGIEMLTPPALAIKLLNNMPNLEDLVLNNEDQFSPYRSNTRKKYELARPKMFDIWDSQDFELESPESVPSCMFLHIKKIYFLNVEWILLKLVKFLLENSKVLERFSATVIGASKLAERKTKEEILNFSRASSICETVFLDADDIDELTESWYEF